MTPNDIKEKEMWYDSIMGPMLVLCLITGFILFMGVVLISCKVI